MKLKSPCLNLTFIFHVFMTPCWFWLFYYGKYWAALMNKNTLKQWFSAREPRPLGGLSKLPRGPQDDLKLFKIRQNSHNKKNKDIGFPLSQKAWIWIWLNFKMWLLDLEKYVIKSLYFSWRIYFFLALNIF